MPASTPFASHRGLAVVASSNVSIVQRVWFSSKVNLGYCIYLRERKKRNQERDSLVFSRSNLRTVNKMVAKGSRKRARPSSTSESEPPLNPLVSDEYIFRHVLALDSEAQESLLVDAARKHPEVLEAIERKAVSSADVALNEGLRLQFYSDNVYYMLHYFGDNPIIPAKFNKKNLCSVSQSILTNIQCITDYCRDEPTFGTKRNALVAYRQICEHIYTANTPVGERIRELFMDNPLLEYVMIVLIENMPRNERDLLKIQGPHENWLYETATLVDETAREGLFCRLSEAVRLVGGTNYNVRNQANMRKNQSLAWRSRMRIGRELRKGAHPLSGITDVNNQPVPEWAM